MKVLVCGGRNFTDFGLFYCALDFFHRESSISVIVHGGATGADCFSNNWAVDNQVRVEKYPANWRKYGRAAGPIRNKYMLEFSKPDIVVAFEGGSGTKHMINIANKAGVPVWCVNKHGIYPYDGE